MRDLLISVLDWWDEHQFDESYPGRNAYDEDPEMVVMAKNEWSKMYGDENPNDWMWLRPLDY